MPWFGIVLYLHLVAVAAAFVCASFIHLGSERLRASETAPEALAALRLAERGGSKMPWVGLALFVTGAYLTQTAFRWTTPWIDVSIAGLVVLEAVGGISGWRQRQLTQALRQADNGRLEDRVRAAARSGVARAVHYLLPLLTLGILLVMVLKPGVWVSIILLVIASGLGALPGWRREQKYGRQTSASA